MERDLRRVVATMIPGVPPPVLDYAFASIGLAAGSKRSRTTSVSSKPMATGPPRYTLRRVDSGPLGDFDIFGRQSDGDSEGRGSFNFAMAEPHGSSAASSSRSTRRR